MDYTRLGKRIKEERLRLNLTQEKLSEKVGISTAYLGQIEHGERCITLDKLIPLANYLGVTVDFLLTDYNPSSGHDQTYLHILLQYPDYYDLKAFEGGKYLHHSVSSASQRYDGTGELKSWKLHAFDYTSPAFPDRSEYHPFLHTSYRTHNRQGSLSGRSGILSGSLSGKKP